MVNKPSIINKALFLGGVVGPAMILGDFLGYLDKHFTSQRSSDPFSHNHGSVENYLLI